MVDYPLAFCGVLFIVCCAVALLLRVRKYPGHLFSMANTWLIALMLWYGFGMYGSGAIYGTRTAFGSHETWLAVFYCYLGLAASLIGFRFEKPAMALARFIPLPRPHFETSICYITIVLCLIDGVAGMGVLGGMTQRFGESYGANLFKLVTYSGYFTAGALATYLLISKPLTPIGKLLSLGVIAGLTTLFMLTWSRSPILSLWVMVVAYYYYMRLRYKGAARVATFIVIGALIISMFGFAMARFRGHREWRAEMFTEGTLEGIKTLQGVNAFHCFAFHQKIWPRVRPYFWGSTFYAILLSPIPRSVWPDKPVGYGFVLSADFWNETIPHSTVSAGITAEMHANFGPVGIIVMSILFAIVIMAWDHRMATHQTNAIMVLIHCALIMDLITLVRGDFISMTSRTMMKIIMFYGLAYIARKLAPMQERPATLAAPTPWPAHTA